MDIRSYSCFKMRLCVLAGILLQIACCVIAERVTLEQVYLDDDHVTDRQKRAMTMPKRLYYDMITDSGLTVRLNLTQIELLPTTIVRGGQSFDLFKSGDNMAAYVDNARDGVFIIKNIIASNGESYLNLEGVFQFGKDLVSVNPVPNARSLYTIDLADSLVDNRGDYVLPPGYVPPPPNNRRALENYIVEITFMADYAIYQKFLADNNNDDAATDTEMRVYYAFHAEQLKIRYKSVVMVDPSISIITTVKKLIIYKDPADISFVENDKLDATSINSTLVLSRAKDYLGAIPVGVQIPPSDHYMVFSGYDLVSSSGSRGNAGLAYTGTVCNPTFGVSLTEDTRRERSAITAAHELGHGLGSKHDNDEGCDDATQNIMTAVSGAISNTAMAQRRWLFSSCSVDAFKRTLATKSCLNDNTGPSEFTTSPKLGQIYTRDQQCKFAVDENSTYSSTTPDGELCYRIRCTTFQNITHFSYRQVLPLDYSDCGTDMWCVQGACVARPSTELPANLPPTLDNVPQTITVPETATGVVFTVESTDPENDAVSYVHTWISPANAENYFVFNENTGEVSVKPGVTLDYNALQNTDFRVSVIVTDSQDASLAQELKINVGQATCTYTRTQDIKPIGDGDFNTAANVDACEAACTASSTCVATYFTNGACFLSTRTATVSEAGATHSLKSCSPQAANTAPSISNLDTTVPLTFGQTGTVFIPSTTDPDPNESFTYTFSWVSPANAQDYFNTNPTTGAVSVKPGVMVPPNQQYVVQITANDGKASSSPGTLTIDAMAAPNSPPTINNPPNSGTSTVTVPLSKTGEVFKFLATDPESSAVTFNPGTWSPSTGTNFFDFNQQTGSVTVKAGVTLPAGSSFSFQVTATDGSLSSSPASLVINTVANDPPVLNTPSSAVSVPVTSTGNIVQFTATDPNNDPIQFQVQSWAPTTGNNLFNLNPADGTVSVRPGVTLVPGTYVLKYVAVDDRLLTSSTGTLTITVPVPTPLNNPPTIINPPNSGTSTVTVPLSKTGEVFKFLATDPESSAVTFKIGSWSPLTGSNYFDFNTQTGSVTVKPGVTLPAGSSFTLRVTATDGSLDSSPASLVINTVANDPPVLNTPSSSASVPVTYTGNIVQFQATDPNNDPIQFQVQSWAPTTGNNLFNLNPADGTVSVRPGATLVPGTYVLKYVAVDDRLLTSSTGTLTITVPAPPPLNNPPTIVNPPNSGTSTVTVPLNKTGEVFKFLATDPESSAVTFNTGAWSPPTGSNYFDFNQLTGSVTVKPGVTLPAGSSFTFQVTATDGSLSSSSASLVINTDANTPPEITNLNKAIVIKNGQVNPVYTVTTVDAQADPVILTGIWSPLTATNIFNFNTQTGVVSLKPGIFFDLYVNNEYTLKVTATDGKASTTKELKIRLSRDDNTAPIIQNLPKILEVQEKPSGLIYTVDAVDNENDNVIFSGVWEPTFASFYFTFDQTTGEVTAIGNEFLTYEAFKNQEFKLTVTASDLRASSTPETLTIRITPPITTNNPPVFSAPNYFVNLQIQNTNIGDVVIADLSNKVTDADPGDTKTFSLVTNQYSEYFNINNNTGTITFKQAYNPIFLPKYFILTAKVTDRAGDEGTANILIAVKEPTTLPGFPNLPTSTSVTEGAAPGSSVFTVTRPPVPGTLTYSLTQSPTHPTSFFTINPVTGEVTYSGQSPLDYEGLPVKTFTLNIKAVDTNGVSTPTETLTVTVLNQNEPPVFTQPVYTVTSNRGPAGQVIFSSLVPSSVNDPDANDVVTFQLLPSPGSQYFAVDRNTGTIRYAVNTANVPLSSQVALTVQASDLGGLRSFARFVINIPTTSNRPPVFSNLPAPITITNSQLSGQSFFDVNAQDPDGNQLTYSIQNLQSFPQFFFNINPTTGQVSIKSGFNIQNLPPQSFDLLISVSDGTTSTTRTLTITVGAVAANQPPEFTRPYYTVNVEEGLKGTQLSASIVAIDPDGDLITYSIISGPLSNYFTIDKNTGVLSYREDYRLSMGLPTSVALSILAVDSRGLQDDVLVFLRISPNSNPASSQVTLKNLPEFTILSRFSPPGSVVYTVQAESTNPLATLTYSLQSSRFRINSLSGAVSVNPGGLSDLTGAQNRFVLTVSVSDGSSTATEDLTLLVF